MGLGYRLKLNRGNGGTYWIYNNANKGIPFAGADSNSSVTSGDKGTYLHVLSYWTGYCFSTVAVDLTNYNKLHFRGTYGVTSNSWGRYYFGITKSVNGDYARSTYHQTVNYQTATLSDDIDVSDLVGTYYIKFQGADGRRYTEGDTWYQCESIVRQIWLD